MILDQLVEPAGVVVETLPGLLEEVVLIFETSNILNIRDQDFVTTVFLRSGKLKL